MTCENLSAVWGPTIFSDIASDLSQNIAQMHELPRLILLNIFKKYDEIFCIDYSRVES
jgi:hypothetical protein